MFNLNCKYFQTKPEMKKLYQENIHPKKDEKQIEFPKYFLAERQQNDQIKVTLHRIYIIQKDHKYYNEIETWVLLANEKKDKNYGNGIKLRLNLEYYPTFQFYLSQCKMEQEICPICLCEYEIKQNQQFQKQLQRQNPDDIYLLPCQHKFHLGCLTNFTQSKDWIKCPICNQIVGKMEGDQPDGDMKVSHDPYMSLPGHGKGVITINYIMKSGSRNGVHFPGTTRTAYLPDDKEGNEVLILLKQAWKRKLIFTVGRSITTGLDNQIVWNGIHHKTSLSGGASHFGYPDPTYLIRVKEQLSAKGVTLQSIK